jgi:hypothetical protein
LTITVMCNNAYAQHNKRNSENMEEVHS